VSFPDTVEAGLRVGHLGSSSVRYEIELYVKGTDGPIAEGWFVHVFVDREERKSRPIPDRIRGSLERLTA
jgi:acyl-CoA thioester hydrolase